MEHHAYLYRAKAVSKETALALLPQLNASEIEYVVVRSFGIDNVRELTSMAYRTPDSGGRLGIVVVAEGITIEAEQALLKLLEEPPLTTAFLFCILDSVFLLPTLLSRFSDITKPSDFIQTQAFADFLSSSLKDRILVISTKLANKDLLWQQEMKQGLIAYLGNPKANLEANSLGVLSYVVDHLLTRGASNKQLFEEIALTIPLASSTEGGTL
jgi:DNA polymerase III, delta subunit